ncbi:EVE domain-containing protein [Macrococcus armenti]|uniref:EVE domain-containing protein n=1 Tax=Macrococcus armenti TaxID=2875764 RepID=UPI001CCF11CB|nr:EVE domain-containing protein [Macrococcus armenti]UBH08448.1 EVE domain-containing protein [Macrococcus armenti]UBH10734.1 EVE domain-containing protein [Macrococcus armenti]
MSYFWLNCGYNRFNHFEDLMGQVSVFDSTVHFNPNEGYQAFKRATAGDRVLFYQVQNKIGLLGAGEVLKVEEPKRGQIKIHFKYDTKLAAYTKDYLVRDEKLKETIYGMKEQLLNPISQEDYEKIINVGQYKEKINRYFLMKEEIDFEPDTEYTIYVSNVNGMHRLGYKHYTEMQPEDKVIIYKTNPERGIYGIAEVVKEKHSNKPMPGRTDTTAVIIKYIEDIKPQTIYELDRELMLRAQYFLDEKWNESVTEITKNQYNAMLEPTDTPVVQNAPSINEVIEAAQYSARKAAYEKKLNATKPTQVVNQIPHVQSKASEQKLLHIFSLPKQYNGLETAIKFMKLDRNAVRAYVANDSWRIMNLYGDYVKESENYIYHRGIITEILASDIPDTLMIENFEHLTVEQLKPLVYAAQGNTISLPVLEEQKRATIGPVGSDATFEVSENIMIIGITHLSIEEYKNKYSDDIVDCTKFYKY